MSGSRGRLTGELLPDIGTDFVAPAADSRPKVYGEVGRGIIVALEQLDCLRCDTSSRTSPAGMEHCNDSRRMGNKDRDAIRDAHRQGDAPLAGDMSVCLTGT